MVSVGSIGNAGAGRARACLMDRAHASFDTGGIESQSEVVVGSKEQTGLTVQHGFRGGQDSLKTHIERIAADRGQRIEARADCIKLRKQRHQPAARVSVSMARVRSAMVWTSATRSSGIEMSKRSSRSMMKSRMATESSPRPPTICVSADKATPAGTRRASSAMISASMLPVLLVKSVSPHESAGREPVPIPVPGHGVAETFCQTDRGAPQSVWRLTFGVRTPVGVQNLA